MSNNPLDLDMKTFLKKQIEQISDNIDSDPRKMLPKKSEKFVQKVLKDDTGQLVVNEEVHNIMHQFRRIAHKKGFRKILILGCFGHGKTEQMVIGLCLEKIAKDPNILIKIVHVSDKEAVNRVRAVSDYIKNDADFKRMCPHVQPTAIWGQEKFIVKRKTISKDPTMQAFSVLSSSLGGRAHLIIYDDINDLKSAVLEPGTRENIQMMVTNVWDTRLIPGRSEVVCLMNRWHENDFSAYVMNNPTWAWMSIAVSEDKENLIYEDSFGKKKILPSWSKYTKKDFEDKHISMGDRDYNRAFRLIAYSDHDKSFPSFESCCSYGIKPVDLIGDMRDWVFAGSVDFSGIGRKGTTLVIGAINRQTNLKVPVEIFTFNNPSDLAETMIDTWQRWGTELYLCENNAVQEAIMDLLSTVINSKKLNKRFSKINIKIEGFNTGRNKLDPTKGLPSLEKEMKNKEWLFCFPKKYLPVDQHNRDVQCRMYKEMLYHPFFETNDLSMSTWILRSAFQRLVAKSNCDCFY